jgi:predicted Kef-type K+ transport protein
MALFSLEVLEVDDVEGRDVAAGYIVTTNVSVAVARTWKMCRSLEEKDDTEASAEAVVVGQTVMRTVSVLVARTVTGSSSSDVVGGIDAAT